MEQVVITPAAGQTFIPAGSYTLRVTHKGSLYSPVSLNYGDPGFGTPAADDPNTPVNEAVMPRYKLVSGAAQPVSLFVEGNATLNTDGFRITNYIRTATQITLTWQSLKGERYLIERSADLNSWETRTATGTWETLAGNPSPPALLVTPATTAVTSVTLAETTTGAARVYYRIRISGMP